MVPSSEPLLAGADSKRNGQDRRPLIGDNISIVRRKFNRVRLKIWLKAFFFSVVLILLIDYFFGRNFSDGSSYEMAILGESVDESLGLISYKISSYLVENKGCRIPAADPFDSISQRYIKYVEPLKCDNGGKLPLIESNESAIYVNPLAQYQYYNEFERANCCWTSFSRKEGHDNDVTFEKKCHRFQGSASIKAEFVKVECFRKKEQIYRDYHAFLPRKDKTEKRCEDLDEKLRDHLSVMFLGVDSISRLHLHRIMPETVKALKSLDAIEFLGYNKVADNTYPNLIPILSGLTAEEMESVYMHDNKSATFDVCPFLWKNFSESGYRTILGEDAAKLTAFNWQRPGYRDPPTDYYLRPWSVAAENDIANNQRFNAPLCLGGREYLDCLLGYVSKVAKTFATRRYFGFYWQTSLGHDDWNLPKLADSGYSRFFQSLRKSTLLDNTVVVVASDHGLRWGAYRQTYQGRMEGSLPFVYFVFPRWWQRKYSLAFDNLRRNTVSLTTPFDLHETLLDILRIEDITEESIIRRTERLNKTTSLPRGISMFLPIPHYRTCSMAGIPEHWCMCHTSKNVSLDDVRVLKSSSYLVEQINELLKYHSQCSVLKLSKLINAKMVIGRTDDIGDDQVPAWIDLTITLQTEPGDAIFESTVRHTATKNQLTGSVARLNAYGNRSACVDEPKLRLYCHCH
ncbi:uncharacterized protein [Venturia canescens]|uniref:uncharacterized protein n=1 Tax=Venturia canescens TaxID=32260 RepID=UPI001C9C6889|nr:uncharacterized protein LOC122411602 [Venturia canescens]